MGFVLTNEGATSQVLVKLGKNAFSVWKVGLFTNNYTPAVTDTWASHPMVSGAGTLYTADLAVDQTSWAGSATGGIWTGTANPLVFTLNPSTGLTIYGYFVYNSESPTKLFGAESYTAPYIVPSGGGVWAVAFQDVYHG